LVANGKHFNNVYIAVHTCLIFNDLFLIFLNTFNLIYGFEEICESKGKPVSTSNGYITYKLFARFGFYLVFSDAIMKKKASF